MTGRAFAESDFLWIERGGERKGGMGTSSRRRGHQRRKAGKMSLEGGIGKRGS